MRLQGSESIAATDLDDQSGSLLLKFFLPESLQPTCTWRWGSLRPNQWNTGFVCFLRKSIKAYWFLQAHYLQATIIPDPLSMCCQTKAQFSDGTFWFCVIMCYGNFRIKRESIAKHFNNYLEPQTFISFGFFLFYFCRLKVKNKKVYQLIWIQVIKNVQ